MCVPVQVIAVCGGTGPMMRACEANGVPVCTYAEARRALKEGDANAVRQVPCPFD
jgi:hypothetical protein